MYRIQFRDTSTGRTRNIRTTDEDAMAAAVRVAKAQGEPSVVELRVRTQVPTRFGTQWADVTELASRLA